MAYFQNDDLEYVVDDYYDMADFEEDPFADTDLPKKVVDPMDSDVEDDFEFDIDVVYDGSLSE